MRTAGPNIGGGDEELRRRSRQPLEIDGLGQNCTQRIASHRVQVVGRQQARHEIHGDIDRRRVQCPAAENHIERSAPQRTEAGRLGDATPEILQSGPGALGPAFGMAIDKHCGIHRARRRAGNAIDSEPRLLEQTIEHAPCECPMRASALQRKIDKDWIASDGGLTWFNRHWTSQNLRRRRQPTNGQVPACLSRSHRRLMERRSRLSNEMRNSLGEAAAEATEHEMTRMRPSETVLLPIASRRLEPRSESETVQYCSFWHAAALHVPWRHEKISSVDLRLVVKQFDPSHGYPECRVRAARRTGARLRRST